jgi:ATP-dependent HslUV protease ATP-binding subunit HslU
MKSTQSLTPREIVSHLDRYIVGQADAKRAVAQALRNRWRRQQVADDLRDEISPKNIIMIGPTGVGKTEIARRLAKLAAAPFLKVEASKFTEVGYVGRDVESMVRDLVETGIALVKAEHQERVVDQSKQAAEERVVEKLLKADGKGDGTSSERDIYLRKLRAGDFDDRTIEATVADQAIPNIQFMSPGNQGQNLGGQGFGGMNLSDMLSDILPKKKKESRLRVPEALKHFQDEEADKLLDQEAIQSEALDRTQNHGIIVLDEIDKVCRSEQSSSADVSREGVQRDLLPVVEGSNVNTRYGMVKTDHILFIAAGAFHVSKPSDLIPELQGRFPIRVELQSLTADEFEIILKEPKNSLIRQYQALLATEGVEVTFTDEAVREIADIADQVNRTIEDIGARRLHTVMEQLCDEISFHAPEMDGAKVDITPQYVRERLDDVLESEDLSRYIL